MTALKAIAILIRRLRTTSLFFLSIIGGVFIWSGTLFCDVHDESVTEARAAIENRFMEENNINILLPYKKSVYEMIRSNSGDDEETENNDGSPSVVDEEAEDKAETTPVFEEKVEDIVTTPVSEPNNSKYTIQSTKVHLKILVWPLIADRELKILDLIEKNLSAHLASQKVKPDVIVFKFDRSVKDTSRKKMNALLKKIWNILQPDLPVPAESELVNYRLKVGDYLIISMLHLGMVTDREGFNFMTCTGTNNEPFAYVPYFVVFQKKRAVIVLLASEHSLHHEELAPFMWEKCLSRIRKIVGDISSVVEFPVVIITTNFYHPLTVRHVANQINAQHLQPRNSDTYDFSPDQNRLAREIAAGTSYIESYEPVLSQHLFIQRKKCSSVKMKYSHRVLPLRSPKAVRDPINTLPFYWSSLLSSYWGQELFDYSPFYPSYFTIRFYKEENE